MRLNDFLQQHLPPEDARTKIAAPRVISLLLNNLLVSREPVYGVAEWAREFDPELFDLRPRTNQAAQRRSRRALLGRVSFER